MSKFYDNIKEICLNNKKVAMFIDMDGTIVEYKVYSEGKITTNTKNKFLYAEPIMYIINELKQINNINNIDLYILTLSKSTTIVNEKKEWLKKYVNFINDKNWIIINKEQGEYNSENRNYAKYAQMEKKLKEYDYAILLDDDHKILKETNKNLEGKGKVFHISSILI